MKFNHIFSSQEERFSIGIEEESNKYFIAIPVTTGIADYLEYYEIDKEDFDNFQTKDEHLKKIAQACRDRKNDSKLISGPRNPRAVPD
jgi:hypothetical protein